MGGSNRDPADDRLDAWERAALADPAYRIEEDGEQTVIHVRSEFVDRAELAKLLDFIIVESIRKRSELTETQAADLACEVKRAAWDCVRPIFDTP